MQEATMFTVSPNSACGLLHQLPHHVVEDTPMCIVEQLQVCVKPEKQIYINSSSAGGATVTLAPSLSLTEVSETHWKVNKPMEMLYSFKRV